ncbi:HAMP domain-containing histidine kinase [Ruficoccus amylovorans]|uniref:histidine kinase n=1 Tax=Ruficoccus amylovorans TaxID=1804625 RepID=A0A842HGV7_9BACT|nr:ATP-binding protein [Ruficoccus amylovorans]MBC2595228.1 HAMP domain-containing histidine kinase [Ruficoccus amylovorans]
MPFSAASESPVDKNPGLSLLINLRWLALGGQVGLCIFSQLALGMLLPWRVLLPCMGVTALTNAAAVLLKKRGIARGQSLCAGLLTLDTLTLTVMLYWTGGSHNPFAIFYLLHIAIATILLSYSMAWASVLLCAGCYALLFRSPHIIPSLSGHEFCGSMDFHLHGMLLSLVLVGMGIVFFVGRLRIMLARREAQLKEAHMRSVRNERFAALATLAAGVAHELATPLGTIALVSEDLAQQAGDGCRSTGCMKDAALIGSEVERCRVVLEKLRLQTTEGAGDPFLELAIGEIPSLLTPYLKPEHLRQLHFKNQCLSRSVRLPQTALLQSLAVLVKNACQADINHKGVLLIVSEAEGKIRFMVEDEGRGMPADVVERLGEPFFTTKAPGEGMGLGLFLVRMFVERINGDLQVDSTVGRGTRVTLVIPRHESGSDENTSD